MIPEELLLLPYQTKFDRYYEWMERRKDTCRDLKPATRDKNLIWSAKHVIDCAIRDTGATEYRAGILWKAGEFIAVFMPYTHDLTHRHRAEK